ncbi:hypothetical protein [Mucilaginibacter phyllosphaerae]|uniref:Uncharacterized protein n=1 Tax=Mucilaginibacter phyllosphaerae TaxID=1812349 RepID=A0A4Y8AA90_9SPHI|nr:hypothetical protein [Mucilaginibacter phyllosphaerae]MBB3970736.1 hypothetical protein [Mucilaginibacter phyllosphaerae]TEW64731.1 hypothetical protein E2R65_17120 [Mucilaginibacter phyllosphaerae]GGH20572.1 hypothetical protein GCM10007352_32670 [Mucilaginibacter phyllosphaerae]
MKRILFTCLLFLTAFGYSFADTIAINHFVVKENPFAKDEIAIIAVDTAQNIQENVSGIFTFTVNSFTEQLTFDKGTAFYRHKIEKSGFVYARHENDNGTHSMLYYIYRHDSKLTPVKISWILLICIPLGLILIGYLFKRFIIIAAVIFCIFLYFNHSNGLSIPTFFQSIIDGLKGLFAG